MTKRVRDKKLKERKKERRERMAGGAQHFIETNPETETAVGNEVVSLRGPPIYRDAEIRTHCRVTLSDLYWASYIAIVRYQFQSYRATASPPPPPSLVLQRMVIFHYCC